MEKKVDRILWSPRIQPLLIKRLYESDALGFQNDELCNQVGFRLYLRCQAVVMVSRDEVACPRCGTIFTINTSTKEAVTVRPAKDRGWQTTILEYPQSWSKKHIRVRMHCQPSKNSTVVFHKHWHTKKRWLSL